MTARSTYTARSMCPVCTYRSSDFLLHGAAMLRKDPHAAIAFQMDVHLSFLSTLDASETVTRSSR